MSDDLTKKLPKNDSEKLTFVVTAVQDLTSRIQALDRKVDALDHRVEALDNRVEALDNRVEALDHRVETLDKKVEERLYDTRPIWEQVVSNVAQLQEGQQRIEATLESSRNESRDSRTVLRDILRRMSIFNDTLVTIQADYRDIYDRVRNLELRHT